MNDVVKLSETLKIDKIVDFFYEGHTCSSSTTTTPSSCICQEIYQPVCSSSNQTFSNKCFAGCDKAQIACQVKDYFSFDFKVCLTPFQS